MQKVVLTKINSTNEYDFVDLKNGFISGNNVVIKNFQEIPFNNPEGVEVKRTRSHNGSFGLTNNNCESEKEYTLHEKIKFNGVTRSSASADIIEITTCAPTLTTSEIKEIELSNIEFCDYTVEDSYHCTSERDMGYLTSDL